MLDILRDPLWQFIGAMLAVVALVATFVIYHLQRQRKGLTFDVLSRASLLTVREELEGKLQVFYEGEPAKSLTLLVVRVWNSGNQPLLAAEVEQPIVLNTGNGARLLTAAVTDVDPKRLSIEFTVEENALTVKPCLLNPGDTFTLKLLVRDAASLLDVYARISGVKSIRRSGEAKGTLLVVATCGMLLTAVGLYAVIAYAVPAPLRPARPPAQLAGIAAIFVGYVITIAALFKARRLRIMRQRRPL